VEPKIETPLLRPNVGSGRAAPAADVGEAPGVIRKLSAMAGTPVPCEAPDIKFDEGMMQKK